MPELFYLSILPHLSFPHNRPGGEHVPVVALAGADNFEAIMKKSGPDFVLAAVDDSGAYKDTVWTQQIFHVGRQRDDDIGDDVGEDNIVPAAACDII
jgi:hypothetical protein